MDGVEGRMVEVVRVWVCFDEEMVGVAGEPLSLINSFPLYVCGCSLCSPCRGFRPACVCSADARCTRWFEIQKIDIDLEQGCSKLPLIRSVHMSVVWVADARTNLACQLLLLLLLSRGNFAAASDALGVGTSHVGCLRGTIRILRILFEEYSV